MVTITFDIFNAVDLLLPAWNSSPMTYHRRDLSAFRSSKKACGFTGLLGAILVGVCAVGCASRSNDAITQVSTIDSLLAGVYEGHQTLGSLKKHGDFGLGTFDRLDGEMILLDGKMFKADASGNVSTPPDSETTPFAAVVYFRSDATANVENADTAGLERIVNTMAPAQNQFVAIRVDGHFEHVRVRSVPAQSRPYRPLVEVIKTQPVFDFRSVRGTLVGFRSPPFVKGLNVPGYHWHFISDDRTMGGHVLDMKITEASVKLDQSVSSLNVFLPSQSEAFSQADLTQDRAQELHAVEQE